MKYILTLIAMATLTFHAVAQPKKKKVVFIIADGIPADVLEKAHVSFPEQIGRRDGWRTAVVDGSSAIGGGSAPGIELPTWQDALARYVKATSIASTDQRSSSPTVAPPRC